MREEYQKSIILVIIIIIFGGLYISSFFDINGTFRSNIFLFLILFCIMLICYFTSKKIKVWEKEYETDYTFVYWSFYLLNIFLILYLCYMFITRSELECMKMLKNNMKGAGQKMVFRGEQKIDSIRNNHISESFNNGSGGIGFGIGQNIKYLFNKNKQFWKTILFLNKNKSVE